MLKPQASTIASGNYQTSKAASDILEAGGNAYDAILAALFMSFVTEPLLSSPGGGGYLLAHPKNKKAKIFDFFAQTPFNKAQAKRDFYPICGDFGDAQQEFHIGLASAAIPGVPAGIFAIHQHYGSLPLIDIASAAIAMAKKGMIIDKLHAEVIQILAPILNHSKTAKALYSDSKGCILKEGDVKKNPQLAQFLTDLASNPRDWFYFGKPAENIRADMHEKHGLLRQEDFENYQVHIRDPLIETINNWKVITNAEPTTGGILITEQLKHATQNTETETHQKFIQAMVHADKLKSQQGFQSSKGTSHMNVIDADGNVASLTISNGEGCGYIVPASGFMLNNFLGEEDINTQGFFNFPENTRMASMMSPTIIEQIGCNNKIALGTGGSNRIKTALFQVIWQIIGENKTLDQAVNHPRFHYEKGMIDVEKGINQSVIEQLKSNQQNINLWKSRSLYFGGINAVQQGKTNLAVSDSRRNGTGLVIMPMIKQSS
jgi:gamma-glutamyltranspeptidase/glutathione hydrolase